MSSGIKVCSTVEAAFKKLKMGKHTRFVTLEIEDKKIMKVERIFMKSEEHAEKTPLDYLRDHLASVKSSDDKPGSRFCFLDYPVKSKSSDALVDTLFLIQYIPDLGNIREKMLYASSANAVKVIADGCKVIQLNDLEELNADLLQQKSLSH